MTVTRHAYAGQPSLNFRRNVDPLHNLNAGLTKTGLSTVKWLLTCSLQWLEKLHSGIDSLDLLFQALGNANFQIGVSLFCPP